MHRTSQDMSWYKLACMFVDMKWPRVAATTRRTHAEAMTAVTTAMFTSDRGKPDDKLIRAALCRWAFNTNRRNDPGCPEDIRTTLRWVEAHTKSVSALQKPEVLRAVLHTLTVRLDGLLAAPSVVNRRRRILGTAMEYGVELSVLDRNPIPALKWTPPKTTHCVERRRVANPIQVRSLLDAVRVQQRSGQRLVAFFGCLYFAANADKLEARRPDLGTLFDDAINPVCRRSKTAGKCTAS
jgi:hypothetical protein